MERMFRLLKASEIDCRVATVSDKGCSLLLYKDARVDQNILDETVGQDRWQRHHEVIDGNLYCNVGIWFQREGTFGEWVWKQDVGTESYTEKEKGQASDSFKRACFNWGIGRELYTAPLIWVDAGNVNIITGNNGKKTTYDRFRVREIGYDDEGVINRLVIVKERGGAVVYTFGDDRITGEQARALKKRYPKDELINGILEHFHLEKLEDMTVTQLRELLAAEEKNREAKNE